LLVTATNRLHLLQRKTQRASVSLPQSVMEDLFAIADENGRSLSNLLAFMIESKLQEYKQGKG
jgi:metal-responsive CopG/Arc/MetJ family transcriptional regulator